MRSQVGSAERARSGRTSRVERIDAAHQPTAAMSPRAGEDREAGDVAVRHGAVLAVLHPDQDADRRRFALAVDDGEALDVGRLQAADLGHPLRRPLLQALDELVVPDRVLGDVVVVHQPLGHEDVHHPQRERAVGAREELHVLVARGRGARAQRVDADHPAARGAGLLEDRPEVPVGDEGVRAPQQDHAGVPQVLRVHATARPLGGDEPRVGRVPAQPARDGADAEHVEQPLRHRAALQDPLVARVAVGEEGGGAVLVDDRAPPRPRCSSSASSQLTRSKVAEPFGPVRTSGCRRRSGWWTRSRNRLTLGHSSPRVKGWSA